MLKKLKPLIIRKNKMDILKVGNKVKWNKQGRRKKRNRLVTGTMTIVAVHYMEDIDYLIYEAIYEGYNFHVYVDEVELINSDKLKKRLGLI